MIGTTISHYRLVGELGRGGMGIVYRAEDTKLNRTVALKLLPASALSSEDDRSRFYREAQAAAALNHANIGHIYEIDEADLGEAETQPFIAMEFIDGETLSARIARGPLPLEEAISIATKIASGLKAAHEKGIVHRDIKSGNVMLTRDGGVKVLDFGLAKTAASTKLTRMGSTIGTAAYMSPEQARGEEVDRRTDIWSLGVILYEMIAGRLPFGGDYEQAVVYGILNEDPESLTALRAGVPLALDGIIAKLLAKDASMRYQHVDELPADLKAIDVSSHSAAARMSTTTRPISSVTGRRAAGILTWPVAASLAAGVLLGVFGYRFASTETAGADREVRRYVALDIADVAGLERPDTFENAVVSPDGRRLLFQADFKLWIRNVNNLEAVPIAGADNTPGGLWIPDGSGILFPKQDGIYRVSLDNGEIVKFATMPDLSGQRGGGALVDERGSVVVALGDRLVRLQSSGSIEPATPEIPGLSLESGIARDLVNDAFFVIRSDSDGVGHISHANTNGVRDLSVLPAGHDPENLFLASSGHLLYDAGGDLWAVVVDPDPVAVASEPRLVAANAKNATVGSDGVLYYTRSARSDTVDIVFYPGAGQEVREEGLPGATAPALSPSGRYLAVAVMSDSDSGSDERNDGVWVLDRELGGLFQLPLDAENPWRPSWSPSGDALVYQAGVSQEESKELWIQSVEGGSAARRLLSGEDIAWGPTWSRDGEWIVYTRRPAGGGTSAVYRVPADGTGEPEPVVEERFGAAFATMSPDGRYVAYWSLRNGQRDIYVSSYPDGERHFRVTTRGAIFPKWRGDFIYFNDWKTQHLMKTRVVTNPSFRAEEPTLVRAEVLQETGTPLWEVSEDGNVVVVVRQRNARILPQVVAVENWVAAVDF